MNELYREAKRFADARITKEVFKDEDYDLLKAETMADVLPDYDEDYENEWCKIIEEWRHTYIQEYITKHQVVKPLNIEAKLLSLIVALHKDIKNLHPKDGLNSPRDLKLVTMINKKSAILDKLQEAMRVITPDFERERH